MTIVLILLAVVLLCMALSGIRDDRERQKQKLLRRLKELEALEEELIIKIDEKEGRQ